MNVAEWESRVRVLENEVRLLKEKNMKMVQLFQRQTQRHKEVQKRLSIHPITGLPNHYQMNQELVLLLNEHNLKNNVQYALILVQLSQSYDMVKRTLKSSVSEWVLYQIANRIRECTDKGDAIYQTRENEFLILRKYENQTNLGSFLKIFYSKIHEPHIFSGFNITLDCHLGVSLYPQDGMEKTTLLHRADIALGAAQEQKQPFAFYHQDLHEQVVEKMELQNSIIKAIEAPAMREIGHQFDLHFQPQLTLTQVSPDMAKVSGVTAEVLIRWHHPTRGAVMPSQFIPIAEETGLIMPIGKWTIYQIFKKWNSWKGTILEDMPLAINISPRQFRSPELVEILDRAIEYNQIKPQQLTLELTETSLFEDPLMALEYLQSFKKLGLKVSVDDFGTGYSSLSHLHKFPLDEIKIDQSFVRDFPDSNQDKAIIRSLTSIAKELQLEIIAEGVEKSEQVLELFSMGCHKIQGYVFSKPLNEEGFQRFMTHLKNNDWLFPLS